MRDSFHNYIGVYLDNNINFSPYPRNRKAVAHWLLGRLCIVVTAQVICDNDELPDPDAYTATTQPSNVATHEGSSTSTDSAASSLSTSTSADQSSSSSSSSSVSATAALAVAALPAAAAARPAAASAPLRVSVGGSLLPARYGSAAISPDDHDLDLIDREEEEDEARGWGGWRARRKTDDDDVDDDEEEEEEEEDGAGGWGTGGWKAKKRNAPPGLQKRKVGYLHTTYINTFFFVLMLAQL